MSALQRLRDAGLHVQLVAGRLRVTPADAVSPNLRDLITANREAIIDALRDDRRHCRDCYHYRRTSVLAGTCKAWREPDLRALAATTTAQILDDLPRRCGAFALAGGHGQRNL
jgi:hypothetical protein